MPGTQRGREPNHPGSPTSEVTDQLKKVADKATDQFKQAADQVEGLASQVTEQGRQAQQVAGNLKSGVDKSVKDQPMATLALAAAVGFVLGALWKS
jgi:ElaB/YqjD/DUF883 family membrane-anchored ribosome-binding protein